MNMDEQLVHMWHLPDSPAHKELVLVILDTLSEDVFSSDDPVVALRDSVLSKSTVEIFTPNKDLNDLFPNRPALSAIRCGEEGWLDRVCQLLGYCLRDKELVGSPQGETIAVKCLGVLTSVMSWIMPKALITTNSINALLTALACDHQPVQKVSFFMEGSDDEHQWKMR